MKSEPQQQANLQRDKPKCVSRLINAVITLTLGGGAAIALAQTYITPSSWNFAQETPVGYGTFVNGPGVPPSGSSGSVQLTVANPGGELFYTLQFGGTALSQIKGLAYNSYVVSSAIPETANLQFDFDPGVVTGIYQGRAVFSPSLMAGAVQVGVWQTWSPMTQAAWWGTGSAPRLLVGACTQAVPCTWTQMLAAFPNAKMLSSGAFGFKVGNSNSAAVVSVDSFSMGTTGATGPVTQYNFALVAPALCAPGTYSASGNVPCINALPGSYVPNAGATSATPASLGYFVDLAAATTQSPCQPGRFAAVQGLSSCTPAAAGFFAAGSAAVAQTACPVGRFADVPGLAICNLASVGFYVDVTQSSTQTACAAGFTTAATGSTSISACVRVPTACLAGTFSGTGSTPCIPAALGHFVPTAGATGELPCVAGNFAASTGASSCTAASPGSFVAGAAAAAQVQCSAGSFSAASSATLCTPASANFFVPTSGAIAQTPCPFGTTSGAGATLCTGLPILNIDDSDAPSKYDAETDGVLLMRYLLGLRGSALTAGALGNNARRDAAQIAIHINTYRALLDVDGDGSTNALTDGTMILRRLLGLSGSALTANAKNSTRSDVDVAAAIDALKP